MSKAPLHIGEILEKEIINSGRSKTAIAEMMDISRKTLDNILERENVSLKYVASLGKILRKDFSEMIPDLKDYMEKRGDKTTVEDPAGIYENKSLAQCIKEKQAMEKKYITELERTNALLRGVIIDLYKGLNLKPGDGVNLEELRG